MGLNTKSNLQTQLLSIQRKNYVRGNIVLKTK